MKNTLHLGPLAIAAVAACSLSATAIAENSAENNANAAAPAMQYRWEVDHRGRPPFKRQRVPVEVVDVAAMETVAPEQPTMFVWQRSSTGKPPFKRQRVEVPVVDVAAMETVEVDRPSTDFRGRPPFRRNR